MVGRVYDMLVHLVGNHISVVLLGQSGNSLQFRLREYLSAGIGRIAEDQRLGTAAECILQLLRVKVERGRVQRHVDRLRPGENRVGTVIFVKRRKHDDLVTGIRHGYHGGTACNVVPDHCVMQYFVRSRSKDLLEEIIEKVNNCAEGAALMTGCQLVVERDPNTFYDMKNCIPLVEKMQANLQRLGITDFRKDDLYHVYLIDKGNKRRLLAKLLRGREVGSALVFTRTKHAADRVVKELAEAGMVAMAIHGNKSQNARQDALKRFKSGDIKILVATDIAARGIDIPELSHVFNYELPNEPETYIHRIGRTGRAGLGGVAISFCDYDEIPYLKDIEKLMGQTIPEEKSEWPMTILQKTEKAPQKRSGFGNPHTTATAKPRRPHAPATDPFSYARPHGVSARQHSHTAGSRKRRER